MRPVRFPKRSVATFAFVAVALLLICRGYLSSSSRVVTLPDGHELTIRRLTYGTEHKFVTGSALAKLVAPALPDSMKPRAGVFALVHKSDGPTVVIWGEWLPNRTPAATLLQFKEIRSGARVTVAGSSMRVADNSLLMAWTLNNFPRRDPVLQFELCDWHRALVASCALPNPAPREFPIWKPDAYPIVKSTNGLKFSMVNFSAGEFIADPWLTIMRHLQLATGYVATFQVAADGRAQENWNIQQITVRDATGNMVRSRLQDSFPVDGYLFCGLDEALWPSERAWKFETEFIRSGGFRSNELCSMPGIPIPVSRTATQMLVSAEANGVPFIGVELQRMQPGLSMHRMREDLEIEPLLPRTVKNRVISLAEVTDDLGRKLIHHRSYHSLDGMHFGIELLPDSRSLDLTFAVQEPVVVEFVGGLSAELVKSR